MKSIIKTINTVGKSIIQQANQVKTLLLISSLLLLITGTIFSQSERTTPRVSTTIVASTTGDGTIKHDTTRRDTTNIDFEQVILNPDQIISFKITKNDDCSKIRKIIFKDFLENDIQYTIQSGLSTINNLQNTQSGVLKLKLSKPYHYVNAYFGIIWNLNGCKEIQTDANNSPELSNTANKAQTKSLKSSSNNSTPQPQARQQVPTNPVTTYIDNEYWILKLIQKNKKSVYTDPVALPNYNSDVKIKERLPLKVNNNPTKAGSLTKIGRLNIQPAIDVPIKKTGENK